MPPKKKDKFGKVPPRVKGKGKGMKQAAPLGKKATRKQVIKRNMKEKEKKKVVKAPMKKKQNSRATEPTTGLENNALKPPVARTPRGRSVVKNIETGAKKPEDKSVSPRRPSPKKEIRSMRDAGGRRDRSHRQRRGFRSPGRRRERMTSEEKEQRRRDAALARAERMEFIQGLGVINIDDDDEDENIPEEEAQSITIVTTPMKMKKERLGSRSAVKNSKKKKYRALARRGGSKATTSSSGSSQKKGSDTEESDSERPVKHERLARSRRSRSPKDKRWSKRTSRSTSSRSPSRSRSGRNHRRSKKRSSSPSSSTSPSASHRRDKRKPSSNHNRNKRRRSPREMIRGGCKYLTPEEAENALKLIERKKDSSSSSSIHKPTSYNNHLIQADFHSLHSRQWVNDSIINAHLDLVYRKVKDEKRKVVLFNSYFWSKLVKFTDDDFSGEYKYDYHGVKGWTTRKNIDIFSNDLVIIPVNRDNIHWSVIAIDMNKSTYSYYCSLGSGAPPYFEDVINQYLADEYKNKKNKELEKRWTLSPGPKTPRQKNGYDCGVFAVRFASCLMQGEEFNFTHSDMYEYRLLIAHELSQGTLKSPEDYPCNQPGFENNNPLTAAFPGFRTTTTSPTE